MEKSFLKSQVDKYSNLFGLDLPYFLHGGFWLAFSTLISFVGGIFLSALFARIWPKDIYGQFSFLMSALGFMSLTALPGMGQALTQSVAEGKDGTYKFAVRSVFRWSMIGFLLLVFGSVYFSFRQNPSLGLATFVSALAFPISSATSLSISFLTGKKNFKKVAIFSIIFQYSSLLATAFALWKFPSIILVALFSAWSTAIAGMILAYIAYKDIENNIMDEDMASLGMHLSLSQFFTISADYLDRFLVPLLLGFTNNAIYAFAILIPMQIHTFFKVLLGLGQPKIASISEKNLFGDLWKKSVQLEIPVLAIVGMYIVLAPVIFKILFPGYSTSATFISQIFSLSLLYYPGNLLSLGLIKRRDTRSIYAMNIVYLAITVISLIILIPLFGLMGAVVSKVIVRSLQAATQFYLLKRSTNSDVNN